MEYSRDFVVSRFQRFGFQPEKREVELKPKRLVFPWASVEEYRSQY